MNLLTENFRKVTTLDIHAFDHPMELRSSVPEDFWLLCARFVGFLESLAELSEVLARLWADVVEEFDNDL